MPPVPVDIRILSPLWSPPDLRGATSGSCGVDLKACFVEEHRILAPGERTAIPAGLAIDIRQPGIAGFIYSRSGLGTRQGLVVSQGVGVIDPDYRGELIVSLLNTSGETRTVTRGQRIAQLIFQPYFPAEFTIREQLTTTLRGAGGFGHTG